MRSVAQKGKRTKMKFVIIVDEKNMKLLQHQVSVAKQTLATTATTVYMNLQQEFLDVFFLTKNYVKVMTQILMEIDTLFAFLVA